ncbi:MAG: ABC transporter substrate-binding protein [Haloarculaceae archaeon]
MRVVSLLPAATEILYALGVEPVGVSRECDYPPAVRQTPAVDRSRVDPDADSDAINAQVAAAEDGAGVYAVRRERLAALDPDLIVTQGVCDVCAVDRVLVREAVADLGLDAEVLTVDVHGLADLYESIRTLGAALERERRAADLVADLRDRASTVETTAARADERPRVAVLDWTDPVMVAGHWVPELVERAGGEYALEAAGARSRPREWGEIRDYDPEVLAVAPCGFGLAQIRENLDDLTDRPGWADLAAVRNGRVHLVDGNHYLNRPGPRLVDAMAYLAALFHPDLFEAPPREAVAPLEPAAGETARGR